MNFSRVLFTYFICFLCFLYITLMAFHLVNPTRNRTEVPDQYYLIGVSLVAASSGKHVFKMAESLSEDCVRTANVTVKLFEKPSTYQKVLPVLFGSVHKAMKDIKSTTTLQEPVELVCKYLNERFKMSRFDFPTFERMKKNVQPPNPAKDYYLETPVEQSLLNRMLFLKLAHKFDDPEFLKYLSVVRFREIKPYFQSPWMARSSTAEAVHQLSQREAFKSTVDSIFEQALDDYIEDLSTRGDYSYRHKIYDTLTTSFSSKVDEYCQQNSVIEKEYQKILKANHLQV